MTITKSILSLWISSGAFACCMMFSSGHAAGTSLVVKMESLDLGGGQSFAVTYSDFFAAYVSLIFVISTLVSLLISWRLNKQPFISKPHLIATLFLAPLLLTFVFP
jgi:hypothetical protein